MYLRQIADTIREHIPEGRLPEGDVDELLLTYAVLVRAKGSNITNSDVHDAWSAWMAHRDDSHPSIEPYDNLPQEVQEQDSIFRVATYRTAIQLGIKASSNRSFEETLFPNGPPTNESETREVLELYKLMVTSSENLVARRQGVNTFFLTMNGALLTAIGLIVQNSNGVSLAGLAVTVLAAAGAVLCLAWRSLISSFGQLNRGKFQVINTLERYLRVAIFDAEWEALGRGDNPKVYRSFTSREVWVPNSLFWLHMLAAAMGVLFWLGILALDKSA